MRSLFTKTQDQEVVALYKSGKTMEQIAEQFGVYEQSVRNSLKRTKTTIRREWVHAIGSKNANWKGGIRMIKGYRHILKPEHPLARKDGYVAEHRLLMADQLSDNKQVVHHLDENRLNNKKDNLKVFPSNGVHRSLHSKTQKRSKKGQFYGK